MNGKKLPAVFIKAEATLLNFHFVTISLPASQPHNQPNNQVKILTNPFFISLYRFIIIAPSFPQGTLFAHSFYKFPLKIGKPIVKISLSWLISAIVVTYTNHIINVLDITRYVLYWLHSLIGIYTYILCTSPAHSKFHLNLLRSKYYRNLHHITVL